MRPRLWAAWEFLTELLGMSVRAVVIGLALVMAVVLPALTIWSWFH